VLLGFLDAREIEKSGYSTIHVFGDEGIIFFRWNRKRSEKYQKRTQVDTGHNSFTLFEKQQQQPDSNTKEKIFCYGATKIYKTNI